MKLPLIAIESVRTLPTNRAVFGEVKIAHVMEGAVEIETADAKHLLTPGASWAIGAKRWCLLRPRPMVRMWTVYADENFLRTQMGWLLPDRTRVRHGLHPHDWDGGSLVISPGLPKLQLLEPLWRQMSILCDGEHSPEAAAARTVELFARWVAVIAQDFLAPEVATINANHSTVVPRPIRGRLTDTAALGQVGRAVQMLSVRMSHPWTVETLAQSVALSRAHLTRLFILRTGLAPIRFLTEVRLTEFARLIEETDMSVSGAAHAVGWSDPRIASTWFYRRFGVTPSQYRLNPHPHRADRDDLNQRTGV